jgi:HSP20 family protein
MANLSIRRNEPRETAATVWDPMRGMDPQRAFDPFRMIRDLMGADPFGGLVAPSGGMFAPDIEIKETKDSYMITADLPGVTMDDLELSVTGNRLTVSGRREEEERREDERYFTYERSYGTFARSFVMPEGADLERIEAQLSDGVLKITVPKRAEVQARKVEIGGKQKDRPKEMTKETKGEGQMPKPEGAAPKKAA